MVTLAQKRAADRIVRKIKRDVRIEEVRENIRKENEYMDKKAKAQKPTREQMGREFDL